MNIDEKRRDLIQLLKVCELEEGAAIGVMLMAKTSEAIEQMTQFIVDKPNCTATQIMKKAVQLHMESQAQTQK